MKISIAEKAEELLCRKRVLSDQVTNIKSVDSVTSITFSTFLKSAKVKWDSKKDAEFFESLKYKLLKYLEGELKAVDQEIENLN